MTANNDNRESEMSGEYNEQGSELINASNLGPSKLIVHGVAFESTIDLEQTVSDAIKWRQLLASPLGTLFRTADFGKDGRVQFRDSQDETILTIT